MEANCLKPEWGGAWGAEKIISGDKERQAPRNKISKSWGYNVQIGNTVKDIVKTLDGGGW